MAGRPYYLGRRGNHGLEQTGKSRPFSGALEAMHAQADKLTNEVETIASVSEENSAAVQEVTAAAEEMYSQADNVTAAADALRGMAETLRRLLARFGTGTA